MPLGLPPSPSSPSGPVTLNVSRSYLQADGAVKKISSYISKKVADKMASLFKNNREDFEAKWNDIKIVIEYGMLSDEKFFGKADKFALYPTVDGKYKLDRNGHLIVDHDLHNHDGELPKGITEAFIEWAKNENLSFQKSPKKRTMLRTFQYTHRDLFYNLSSLFYCLT